MIYPEWTIGNIIIHVFLAATALFVGPMEYYGQALMAYSKFRPVKGIPSRVGMFLLYFVPLLAAIFASLPYIQQPSLIQLIVFAAVTIHCAKRVLEVLFLHRYSGVMGIFTTVMITCFYSFIAYLVGYLNRTPLQTMDTWFYLGIILYLASIIGNFYHHKLLADLRKNSVEYFIPTGGLFNLVVCPHYLFEIVLWLGIFLLSRHAGALLILAFVIAYLTARSLRTLKWYREKFTKFPARKAIIPFII